MKHIQSIVNTLFACALIFLLGTVVLPNTRAQAATPTPSPEPATSVPLSVCDSTRTIQVSGTAVVNIKPDRALIKLGVQSNGRLAQEAQARNAAAISRVTNALRSMDIESRDIATEWYTVEPLYDDYASLHIEGYRIYNIVEVTVRSVDRANEVIIAAFQAGANQVMDVEFYTSELRKYRDQARQMAMNAASEKASALARAAGADVGCILNINENSSSYFNGWGWWYGGNNQNLWTQNASQNIAPAGGTSNLEDGPVSAGMISIRAEVTASFSLK